MYLIKQTPEDFHVKELANFEFKNKGRFKCYLLKKRNYTTLRALELISKITRIHLKNFGYCGNKDKNAVTEQFISVNGNKNLDNIKINNIKLEFLGYLDKKISLGDNIGNYFEIVIKNVNKKYNNVKFMVNYFDEQRFSKNNVLIGKYLLQRKFREICKILDLDDKNPINSLNKVNKKILRLYLHAHQSYLFNKAVSLYLINKYKTYKKVKYSLGDLIFVNKYEKLKFPLINFDTEFNNKDNIYLNILKNESIKLEQFLIRELPWLIEETSYREIFVKVKNFKLLNFNKNKQKISFILPKGSYATILIKQLF